jgi:EAL domain-containing protein (putative c-di-GMP-specific phosphodiesterase class I)/GGDEF domain-containing protein
MDPGVDAEVISQLLTFVEQTTEFVGVSDPWGRILYLNPAAQKRLGVVDVEGLSLADLFPPEAFGFYYEVVRPELLRTGAWTGDVLVNAAGSGPIPMRISTTARLGPGGETDGGVVLARDLGGIDPVDIAAEGDIDELTGLLSRSAFELRMRQALLTTRHENGACALVVAQVIDATDEGGPIDDVSSPNVMRAVGGRIARRARTIDIAGCTGDRQLGLFLRGVRSHGEALRIAQMVQESLVDPPITTPGGAVTLSVTCGVAFGEPGDDPAVMIRRAVETMASEAPPRVVDDRRSREADATITMDDFRVSLSHGHVVPYAQPVVDLATGAVVGYRGCARWGHRSMGLLNAGAFIGMIADTPLANEVDLYVARETAAVLLLATRNRAPRLYTPVSKRLISDVRTEQYLSEIADAYFLTMGQMHLQLARPLLDHATPAFEDALQSLWDAGLAFVLTGVEQASEVDYPADRGFGEVHLSRRLVQSAATEPAAMQTIDEIVRVAHERGLLVAATGVHDRELERALVALGCDLATGDVFRQLEPTKSIEGPVSFER